MTLEAFHSYKELYEDFFEAGFKRIPKHNLVDQYDMLEGKVRIERNSNYWYFYTPESLTEWELFTLIEVRKHNPQTLADTSALIRSLAQRKGITLTTARKDMLLGIFIEVTRGYGIIGRILKDGQVHALDLIGLNTLCTLRVTHTQYGECQTNVAPSAELINRIIRDLNKAGCTDDGACSALLADLQVHATLYRNKTAALETVRIGLVKN